MLVVLHFTHPSNNYKLYFSLVSFDFTMSHILVRKAVMHNRHKITLIIPIMYLAFCIAALVQSTLGPSEQKP